MRDYIGIEKSLSLFSRIFNDIGMVKIVKQKTQVKMRVSLLIEFQYNEQYDSIFWKVKEEAVKRVTNFLHTFNTEKDKADFRMNISLSNKSIYEYNFAYKKSDLLETEDAGGCVGDTSGDGGQGESNPSPEKQPALQPNASPIMNPSPAVNPIVSSADTSSAANQPAVSSSGSQPAISPAIHPAVNPAIQPAVNPATQPAISPAIHPAVNPAIQPAVSPIIRPSANPIFQPTGSPINHPTSSPTVFQPTIQSLRGGGSNYSEWSTIAMAIGIGGAICIAVFIILFLLNHFWRRV